MKLSPDHKCAIVGQIPRYCRSLESAEALLSTGVETATTVTGRYAADTELVLACRLNRKTRKRKTARDKKKKQKREGKKLLRMT